MAFQVVLDDLPRPVVRPPQCPTHPDMQELGAGLRPAAPLVEEFSVLVEDLDATVGAVAHEDAARLRVHSNAMYRIEVVRARLGRGAPLAPVQQELAVLVELGDAVPVVPIGYVEAA